MYSQRRSSYLAHHDTGLPEPSDSGNALTVFGWSFCFSKSKSRIIYDSNDAMLVRRGIY